jgi:transposase-like protein
MDQNSGSKPKHKKAYSEEFRRSVVEQLLSSGKSIAQVASEFGIPAGNLRVWKQRYGPACAEPDAGLPKSPEELARENLELRRELARVITQRDILKKTLLIVSEPSNRDIR